MANVKKGQTVRAPEWWRHLRAWSKRAFWKRQRKAFKRDARERGADDGIVDLDGRRERGREVHCVRDWRDEVRG